MLSPEYLRRITEGSEQIAEELHQYIISEIVSRMMARIGRGEDYILTNADAWRIRTLQESGKLLEDILAELSKYTKREQQELLEAFEDAGITAMNYDDKIYKAAGLSPVPLEQSPAMIRLMERNMMATLGEWKNYTATTANAAQRLYIEQCDLAYNKVITGATSYTQAVKEAITKIAADGVTVTYPTGHTDTIETATARAVRTGIAQATGDISIKRMEEMEWDIILVSAHVGARTGDGEENPGNHFWWQGKYYSRSGNDKRFPPFSATGYGSGEGLCGWNCRHSFGSGTGKSEDNPYKDISSEENRKVEESVENCPDEKAKFELQLELDQKSALLSKQNKAYNQFCRENDLKPLRERLQIAEWNREKAMKAAGAARRYESDKNK